MKPSRFVFRSRRCEGPARRRPRSRDRAAGAAVGSLCAAACVTALWAQPAAAQQTGQGGVTLPQVTVETQKKAKAAQGKAAAKKTKPQPVAPAPASQPSEPAQPEPTPYQAATGPVKGIVAKQSATGTKTGTPLIETPQSISVVTKDQMRSQGVRSTAEALRYEAGVVSETRVGDRFDNVFIRGFGGFGANANYLHFWDGLRLPRGVSYAMPSIDPFTLERVEILRGPASVLYGQNNLGGMVNLISKEPTETPQNEIVTRFGDHNRIESGFDFSGPATEDGKLLYRVIGLGRKADAEVDYNESERWLIAPSFTWRPDSQTQLTVKASYDHDPSSYQPNWLPAYGTLFPNPNGKIPSDFFIGNPYFNEYDREQWSIGYEFEHSFDEVWTVRQSARYMSIDSDFKAMSSTAGLASTGFVAPGNCPGATNAMECIARIRTYYIEGLSAFSTDNEVEAKFATGALDHRVLAGVDYQWSSADALFHYSAGPAQTQYYIDYTNPIYSPVEDPPLNATTDQTRTQTGVYLQDQVRLDRLAVVAGLRYDWADGTSRTVGESTPPTNFTNPSDEALTWRAGATYLFDNGLAPYFSYSTSFEPTIGNDWTGAAFEPTTGEQYEGGIKYEPRWFNGLFMLSLFDITQQNVLGVDPDHRAANSPCSPSGPNCQIQLGEVRSRGAEVSAKLNPIPGLDIITSYSRTNIEITRSSVEEMVGRAPVGVPKNTANLWASYTIPEGFLKGWGLGGGVRYVGESNGDPTNPLYVVPSYTLYDAEIHYDLARVDPDAKGWSFAVNGANLADKRYVSACATLTQCFLGNGRTILGTLRYEW